MTRRVSLLAVALVLLASLAASAQPLPVGLRKVTTTSAFTGSGTTPSPLDLTHGCSNGQVLLWNSGSVAWVCTTISSGVTTSAPLSGTTALSLLYGSGLTLSGSNLVVDTSVILPLANISGTSGDLGLFSGTHAIGNYAGSSPSACSAGSFDTNAALAATGALTHSCTATGLTGLTTNTLLLAASGTTVGNSLLTDNGSQLAYDGTAFTVSTTGNGFLAGTLELTNSFLLDNGVIQMKGSSENYIFTNLGVSSGNQDLNLSSAGTGTVRVNYNGGGISNAGTGGLIVYGGANGSTPMVTISAAGSVVAASGISSGSSGISSAAGISATTTLLAGADISTTAGHLNATTTAPTITSGCGSSPTAPAGSDQWFTFTTGSGVVSSCTITFNKTWVNSHGPICVIDNETSSGAPPTNTTTTTTVVIAGSSSTKYNVMCGGY
jgi:hypothetical protein